MENNRKEKIQYYTSEKNVQIVISLLKQNGIHRVIASPGTTNMTFVGSIQNDSFFEIYSSVDERSAAYMACGLALETGEPVVISCTGATASRNYMPGLTEAYYRKLPVLAITSHRGDCEIGHLIDQQIDRRQRPADIVMESVTVPMVKDKKSEKYCIDEANKAILALFANGGGPSHINLYTEFSRDFNRKLLPEARCIRKYTAFDNLPELPQGKIGILIGSHKLLSAVDIDAIDRFCAANNAVVFTSVISGYNGNYGINYSLIKCQRGYTSPLLNLDLVISIGELLGTPSSIPSKETWRISMDGQLRDTFGSLTKIFQMPESCFFNHYSHSDKSEHSYYEDVKAEDSALRIEIPELPFSNLWIAQQMSCEIPDGSRVFLGILNTLRVWNYFPVSSAVKVSANVGGYGIDGGVSTMIGASLARPDQLYFGIFGDLGFFYDMNVIGNRHVGSNVRIMLINNGRGMEFRNYNHPCAEFGDDADLFMAAAGHFGNQSRLLVRHYAEDLNYQYLSASSKDEFLQELPVFVSKEPTSQPIVFEIFTDFSSENEALRIIQHLKKSFSLVAIKDTLKDVVPSSLYLKCRNWLNKT